MAHNRALVGAPVIGSRPLLAAVARGSGSVRRRLGLALVAVVTLALAACGGGDGDPEVRRFSDVQDGELAFAFDNDPSTEWSPRGGGDGAFVAIDLGDEREVRFTVQASTGGSVGAVEIRLFGSAR